MNGETGMADFVREINRTEASVFRSRRLVWVLLSFPAYEEGDIITQAGPQWRGVKW